MRRFGLKLGVAVITIGIILMLFFVMRMPVQAVTSKEKLYHSVEIQPGDSLWGIAKKYAPEDMEDVRDYVQELVEVNGLTSTQIHSGRYLTVVVYEE